MVRLLSPPLLLGLALAGLTSVASPDPSVGLQADDAALACIDLPRTAGAAGAAPEWHAFPGELDALAVAIRWSDYFQAYETSFANRSDRAASFRFVATAGGGDSTVARRALRPGEHEAPPGHGVAGVVPGGRVCVRLDDVRFAAQDAT